MSESGASAYTSVRSDCNSRLHVPLEACEFQISRRPLQAALSLKKVHSLTLPSSPARTHFSLIRSSDQNVHYCGTFFVLCFWRWFWGPQTDTKTADTTSLQSCEFDMGSCSVQRLFKEKLQWLKPHVPQQPDQPSSDTPSPPDPVNYSSTLANERVEDQALIKAIKWIKHFPL